MPDFAGAMIAALLYPGLLWALLLTLLLARLLACPLTLGGLLGGLRAALSRRAPLVLLLGLLLPLISLPFLAWPYGAQPLSTAPRNLLTFWALQEAAAALALLPGLRSPSPYATRAAMREAQLSLAGRLVIWLAVGVLLWSGPWESLRAMPAGVLALLALLAALPVAAGWGPFAPEPSVTPGGAEAGLERDALELAGWGRLARFVALLSLAVVSLLPSPQLIPELYRLAVAPAALLLIMLGLRMLSGRFVRRPLPDALLFCWRRALPLALLGLAALLLR